MELNDAQALYPVAQALRDEIRLYFSDARTFHLLSALSIMFCRDVQPGDACSVLVNLRHGWMDMVAVKGSRIAFAKSFRWESVFDVQYYVLRILEYLQVTAGDVQLYLSGGSCDATLIKDLKAAVGNVQEAIFQKNGNPALYDLYCVSGCGL
jgi:hypothetical protein